MLLEKVIASIDVWKEWEKNYQEYVPGFIEEAINKQRWQDWKKEIFEEYFEAAKNQTVSSLAQGYFSNVEKERIKNNWQQIAPLLKKIAESQDVPLFDAYQEIRTEILKHTDSTKNAAIHRLIAGLQPKLLCTIVTHKHLNDLYTLLKNKCNVVVPNYTFSNWFKDSYEVYKLFKTQMPEHGTYQRTTYPWQVLEFLRENDITRGSDFHKSNDMEIINLLKYKKQIILQGPPGTGKTREAKRIAEQLINPVELTDDFIISTLNTGLILSTPSNDNRYTFKIIDVSSKYRFVKVQPKSAENEYTIPFDKIIPCYSAKGWNDKPEKWDTNGIVSYLLPVCKYLYEKLNDGFITVIQFHPSYSYEDFVRGIVAESKGDKIEYKNVNKVIGHIAETAGKNWEDSRKDVTNVSKEKKVKEYFDLFADKIADQLADGITTLKLTNSVSLVDTEEDAFRYKGTEGWTTLGNRMPFKDIIQAFLDGNKVRQDIKKNKNLSGLAIQHATYFVRVLNMFQEFLTTENLTFEQIESVKQDVKNYVLIIDEINRGNLSSVLGELIYAMEYRGEKVESMYAIDGNNELILPPNLFIIGTMNTADRSVGHIDYAVRRRFAFVDVPAKDLSGELGNSFHKVLFDKVADLFKTNLSPEFNVNDVALGHSYFIDKTKEGGSMGVRLEYEIKPILKEYVKDGILVGDNIWESIDQLSA